MLRLNLRNGESVYRFGSAPTWGIVDGGDISPEQAAAAIDGRRVLVLVHGYRVEDPVDAYLRVWSHVALWYDVLLCAYWPASDLKLGFWFACRRTRKAGQMLAAALAGMKPAALDLEGHSRGCGVVLEALAAGLEARNAILAGAAVDNESIQVGEQYEEAVRHTRRMLVACSARDKVLREAYTLGMWDKALGLHGPQDPDRCDPRVSVVDCTPSVSNHSAYKADSTTFYRAWEALIP
jgi:hypothetical protein